MITKLSITFGTKAVLTDVIKKHPDRKMLLLASSSQEESLALLDVSGQESTFASPLHYDIKLHRGATDWQGFFYFMYFNSVSPEDQQIFNAKASQFVKSEEMPEKMRAIYFMKDEKNRANNIILSVWKNSADYASWKRSASFKPFDYFAAPLNNFHEASYHTVKD